MSTSHMLQGHKKLSDRQLHILQHIQRLCLFSMVCYKNVFAIYPSLDFLLIAERSLQPGDVQWRWVLHIPVVGVNPYRWKAWTTGGHTRRDWREPAQQAALQPALQPPHSTNLVLESCKQELADTSTLPACWCCHTGNAF